MLWALRKINKMEKTSFDVVQNWFFQVKDIFYLYLELIR